MEGDAVGAGAVVVIGAAAAAALIVVAREHVAVDEVDVVGRVVYWWD